MGFVDEVEAVVQPIAGVDAGPALEAELVEYCRTHVATYKCPRTIEFDHRVTQSRLKSMMPRTISPLSWSR